MNSLIASESDGSGPLARQFRDAARKYRLDVCAMLILFGSAALLTGRIWRFAYDVELFYFGLLHLTFLQKLNYGDIHSPLPLLFFTGLRQLGLADGSIRLVSMAATGVALALTQILAFATLEKRGECPLHVRFLSIILFALAPLALGMGDSIRWYPLFALAFSAFITLYLAGGNSYWRLAAGALLGVAASIDFLAIFVALPFAVYRYGLERQFRLRFDAAFWALAIVFGSAGLWSAYGVATHPALSSLGSAQFAYKPFNAIAENILGFFGGNAIGLSHVWVVIPAVLVTLAAAATLVDRRCREAPVHLFLLMLCSPIIMTLGGFSEPRVFLYLAPIAVALQILFLDRQGANLVLICGAALMATELGAVADLYHAPAPFKRESSIPHDSVIDFVKTNEKDSALVITTDEVLADALSRDSRAGRCVSLFFMNASCFGADRHYDTIILIYGYSALADVHQNMNLTTGPQPGPRDSVGKISALPDALTVDLEAGSAATLPAAISATRLAGWLGNGRPDSTVHFGEDTDAALKSRLSGTRLAPYLLTAELFSVSDAQ